MTDEKIVVNNDIYEKEKKKEYNDDLPKIIIINKREMKRLGDVLFIASIAGVAYMVGLFCNSNITFNSTTFGLTFFSLIALFFVSVYMMSESVSSYYKYN